MTNMILRSQSRQRERQSQSHDSNSRQQLQPRKRKNSNRRDIVNELDDNLILHILSFLPTKDAVKTCVLSKRWLYLWAQVPVLSFQFDCTSNYYNRVGEYDDNDGSNALFSFVDKTLFFHRCQGVKKFALHLRLPFVDFKNVKHRIYSRINWALLANVKEMDLQFDSAYSLDLPSEFSLPQQFYACSSVTKLNFSCMNYDLEYLCPRWASLKVCRLRYMLNLDFVDSLISGSPLLESLELFNCLNLYGKLHISSTGLRNLVLQSEHDGDGDLLYPDRGLIIEAPHLHSLSILGDWSHKIQLGDLSSVISANIDFIVLDTDMRDLYTLEMYKQMTKEMLERLSHVTELALGPWCFGCLPCLTDENFSLPLLKRTKLSLSIYDGVNYFARIISLLHHSYELETLSINSKHLYLCWHFAKEHHDPGKNDLTWKSYMRSSKTRSVCLLSHLKTVKIMQYLDEQSIILLLQFFLKETQILEKMVIPKAYIPNKVRDKLLGFPKSSPHAMILHS